ncbi:MAG: ABC transporter permease [Zavarzinella sp.]
MNSSLINDETVVEQHEAENVSPPELVAQPSGQDHLPITVIERRPGWHLVNFGELWRTREILFYLAWRDIKVRYKQTVLGIAWAFVQPLLSMVVFAIFFGRMGGMGTGVENYAMFVFAGILLWTFFQIRCRWRAIVSSPTNA